MSSGFKKQAKLIEKINKILKKLEATSIQKNKFCKMNFMWKKKKLDYFI